MSAAGSDAAQARPRLLVRAHRGRPAAPAAKPRSSPKARSRAAAPCRAAFDFTRAARRRRLGGRRLRADQCRHDRDARAGRAAARDAPPAAGLGAPDPRRPSPIRRRRSRPRSRCPTRRCASPRAFSPLTPDDPRRWQRGQLLHELLRHLPGVCRRRSAPRRRGASSPSRRMGWPTRRSRTGPTRRSPSPRRRRTPPCSPRARAPRCR